MPAPLAKGLIISLSLLFAAGLAVYENPQVRQWVDESRRKVAIALHSLGDEFAPPSESREDSPDASTREDEDPEAVERRRRARQAILERGRIMEEQRKAKQPAQGNPKSIDDLVDKHGSFKPEETSAVTTAAEPQADEPALRHRQTESQAAVLGSSFANPFADEIPVDPTSALQEQHSTPSRSSTPTLPRSPAPSLPLTADSPTTLPPVSSTFPPVPPKPAAYQRHRLLIDTEEASNHPSEQFLDLTPTTSASSAATDLAELTDARYHPTQSNYWSVNEWAQNSAPAFYSPPGYEVAAGGVGDIMVGGDESERSQVGSSGEHASRIGSEDLDVVSDDEMRISTPGSWSEVGSQFSEDY